MILLSIAVFAWLIFYIIGLPSNYYSDWSLADKMNLAFIGFFATIPFITFVTLLFLGGNYVKTSLWFAFYASIPLFILDYIFVGIINHEGLHFLISHWYLSFGYLLVWIIMPIVGLSLEKLKKK